MTRTVKRVLIVIGISIAVPVGLLASCVLLDQIPMAAARPPKNLGTIDDFRAWKSKDLMGEGRFENSNQIYTVMLAPAGRNLASGPSAYLFDEQGRFIDWTADMGDCYTVKYHFDLTSGHVKDLVRTEKR